MSNEPTITGYLVPIEAPKQTPLRRVRVERGLGLSELARLVGTNPQQIDRLDRGETRMSKEWADRLAPVLRVSAEYLIFGETTAPLAGCVLAAAEVTLYGKKGRERVKMPPNGTERTVGLEIKGNSLGPALSGWVAYYEDRHEPPTEQMLKGRRLAVVCLDDGSLLIRRIGPGRQEGRYDLWPIDSSDPIQDCAVKWAAPITALMPRG